MPYSLVNVPALGYDLVRLPRGDQVARVLRAALGCGPAELAALAASHPGGCRTSGRRHIPAGDGVERLGSALGEAADALGRAAAGDADPATVLLHRLERAAIGDLPALERLLRRDVLDWTWSRPGDAASQSPEHGRAADVLVDAAAAAYCAERLDEDARRRLAAPFVSARLHVPEATGHPAVDDVLAAVAGSDETTRRAWRRAVDEVRPGTATWAPAMHQATWAVHLSDRLRLAADAQLAAVVAFGEAGFGARDAAYGVWNALSGTVQATVVADLLPDADLRRLTAVWDLVRGL